MVLKDPKAPSFCCGGDHRLTRIIHSGAVYHVASKFVFSYIVRLAISIRRATTIRNKSFSINPNLYEHQNQSQSKWSGVQP
jgi:hypothetical protein